MAEKIALLHDLLKSQPNGAISDPEETLISLLVKAWEEFVGSDVEGTDASKLSGRVTNLDWHDPVLTFDIERHGAFCVGSSRASVHNWSLNLARGTARVVARQGRQMTPQNPRLDVRPIARRLVDAILAEQDDAGLQWLNDRTSVRILTGTALETGGRVSQQTQQGRSKRLRAEIESLLAGSKWQKGNAGYFELHA